MGICHNVFWTEPKRGGPLYAHVRWVPFRCSRYAHADADTLLIVQVINQCFHSLVPVTVAR